MNILPALQAFFQQPRIEGELQNIIAADTFATVVTNNLVQDEFGSPEWFSQYVNVLQHTAIALDDTDGDYTIAFIVANGTIRGARPYSHASGLSEGNAGALVGRLQLGARAILEELKLDSAF